MKHSASTHTLHKGARLLVVRTPGADSVFFSVSILGGFRSVPKNKHHLPHLLEHLAFEGSADYPSAAEVAQEIERNGGHYNASTSEEYLNYEFYTAKDDVSHIIAVAFDCIYRPRMDSSVVEEERQVIDSEINEQMADYFNVLAYCTRQALAPELFPDFEEQLIDLSDITTDEIVAYHKEYFTAANSVFVLVGDITPKQEDKYVAQLNTHLEKIKKGRRRLIKKQVFHKVKPLLGAIRTPKVDNCSFSLSFAIDDTSDKIIADLTVLETILLSSVNSRIQNKIRKQGLSYGLEGGLNTTLEASIFTLAGITKNQSFSTTLSTIIRELAAFSAGFVEKSEIERAKGNMISSLKREIATPAELAGWYEHDFVLGNPVVSPEERINNIQAVTVESVTKTADTLFQKKNVIAYVAGYKIDKKWNEADWYLEQAFNDRFPRSRSLDYTSDGNSSISGKLICSSATEGWKGIHFGELWLTEEGLLRIDIPHSKYMEGADLPVFSGKSPAAAINRTALTDPENIFIERSSIISYSLSRGFAQGKLTLTLETGKKYKFSFIKKDMDYDLLRQSLDRWTSK